MSPSARRLALVLGLVFGPPLAGSLLFDRARPVGRTSHSATRVGHRAAFELLDRLGYRPRRFARAVARMPEGGVWIALEPGPLLFRDEGRGASGLRAWIEAGGAALVTLGPDPDRDAELDDVLLRVDGVAGRALDAARGVERRARARAEARRDAADGDAPTAERPAVSTSRAERVSASWSPSALSAWLERPLPVGRYEALRPDTPCPLVGPLADGLPEPALRLTRPRVFGPAPGAEVLVRACGAPLIVEQRLGRGLLLLVAEPRIWANGRIGHGAHAALLVRAVERLAAHTGSDEVWFEELSHGGRELAGIWEVLTATPARWPFAQLLLAALVGALAIAGRHRSPVSSAATRRRARREGLEAAGALLASTGDHRGVHAALVRHTRARLARRWAPGQPEAAARSAIARRLDLDEDELEQRLDPVAPASAAERLARARTLAELRRRG